MPNAIQIKQKIYLDVAKALKSDLDSWRRGVSIENRAGEKIDNIVIKACVFRVRLAGEFLRAARSEALSAKPNYRTLVGRGYYSMYHNVRAMVYFSHGGDDHEAHSNVAKEIPLGFPDRADWQNKIRSARLERNRADYDPFPLANSSYKASSLKVFQNASELAAEVKKYLRAKGVSI